MVDIQLKILDISTASPAKHSLYLKNEENLLKKVWPGISMTTISDVDANSSRFVLKIGSSSIGDIPLIEFTKDWIHGSKEIHGYRISLAYRILMKRATGSQDLTILQEKLKESQKFCRDLSDKLKKAENTNEIFDLYTKALESFKSKEEKYQETIQKLQEKKRQLKSCLADIKSSKEKLESELWLIKEELQLEKLKTKYCPSIETQKTSALLESPQKTVSIESPTREECETLKSENSFRFSFGPEGGSEDFEKNLESLLSEILQEKNIDQNILQVSTGIFYIGKVRVQVKIEDGEVLAYYKKKYIKIDEFLDIHYGQPSEPRRSLSAERIRPQYDSPSKPHVRKNSQNGLNSSMKIVQDIDKMLEYSSLYKTRH